MMTLDEFMSQWRSPSPVMSVSTSGSTGAPKTIRVEKERMAASARMTCRFLGLKEGDSALLCMSLDYIAGKMMAVRAIVGHLRLVCVEPRGHPLSLLPSSLNEGCDFAAMVPLQVYNSLQVPGERERLKKIRRLIIGGGAVSDMLSRELRTFPYDVWSTYGMTETLSHIAMRRLSGAAADEWYEPLEDVSVSLERGTRRVIIDAPGICRRRLVTNDIGEMAPDGRRFRILGRIDGIVSSGGVKIQTEEVERLLAPRLRVPFIITKRPDDKFGEAVVLLTESTDLDAIKTVCRDSLPRFMIPRDYITVDHLPVTPTGKPAREEARRMALGYFKG